MYNLHLISCDNSQIMEGDSTIIFIKLAGTVMSTLLSLAIFNAEPEPELLQM